MAKCESDITSGMIQLNSKNSTLPGETGANFTINLGYSIIAKKLIMDSIVIPKYFTNINAWNNEFNVRADGGGDNLLFVPVAQYTAGGLCTELGALVTAAVGFVVGFGLDVHGYTIISVQPGHSIRLVFTRDIAQMLGFNDAAHYNGGDISRGLFTIDADGVTGAHSPYIASNEWQNVVNVSVTGLQVNTVYTGASFSGGNQFNFLVSVPNDVDYQGQLIYRQSWGQELLLGGNVAQLKVTLYDDRGRVMSLQGKDTIVTIVYYK